MCRYRAGLSCGCQPGIWNAARLTAHDTRTGVWRQLWVTRCRLSGNNAVIEAEDDIHSAGHGLEWLAFARHRHRNGNPERTGGAFGNRLHLDVHEVVNVQCMQDAHA